MLPNTLADNDEIQDKFANSDALAVPSGTKVRQGCYRVDRRSPNDQMTSMMSLHSNPVSVLFRGAALALTILFFAVADGNAQRAATQSSAVNAGPFDQLAGS